MKQKTLLIRVFVALNLLITLAFLVFDMSNDWKFLKSTWSSFPYPNSGWQIIIIVNVLALVVLLSQVGAHVVKRCPSCNEMIKPSESGLSCPHCGANARQEKFQEGLQIGTREKQVGMEELSTSNIERLKHNLRFLNRYYLYLELPVAIGCLIWAIMRRNDRSAYSISDPGFTFTVFIAIFIAPTFIQLLIWSQCGKCPNCRLSFPFRLINGAPLQILYIPNYCRRCGLGLADDKLRKYGIKSGFLFLFRLLMGGICWFIGR